MHVEVGHVLKRDLAIGDEEVDAACAQGVPNHFGEVSSDSEGPHRRCFIQV